MITKINTFPEIKYKRTLYTIRELLDMQCENNNRYEMVKEIRLHMTLTFKYMSKDVIITYIRQHIND